MALQVSLSPEQFFLQIKPRTQRSRCYLFQLHIQMMYFAKSLGAFAESGEKISLLCEIYSLTQAKRAV